MNIAELETIISKEHLKGGNLHPENGRGSNEVYLRKTSKGWTVGVMDENGSVVPDSRGLLDSEDGACKDFLTRLRLLNDKLYPSQFAILTRDLKERYYDEEDLEKIRNDYDSCAKEYCDTARPIETGDFSDVFLVTEIKYDHEDAWGCRPYSLLVKKEDKVKASTMLKNALQEFYDCASFHDEVTGLGTADLVRIFATEADFPIVMFFSKGKPWCNTDSGCERRYREDD